jgi:hypothetical protein
LRSVNLGVAEGDGVGGLVDSTGAGLVLGDGESATGPGAVHETARRSAISDRGIRASVPSAVDFKKRRGCR